MQAGRREWYCCSQICKKFHAARAAVAVVFAVVLAICDENVPRRNVELVAGGGDEELSGMTIYGTAVSSMLPLMSVS